MPSIDTRFIDIGAMDAISARESPIHRLDPRAKVLTTLVFVATVVSFEKHEVSGLIPFFFYPLVLIGMADLPVGYLLRKILVVAPFAFLIAIFNPILDREPLMQLGPIGISGGWVSFASIMLRFLLTVGGALILIATTGFSAVCMALERLGVPRIFVVQLLFLHRYLFVLVEEASRMVRARALRSFTGRGMGAKVFGYMAGHLLLRTLDRAQRIHLAMLSRGFDGTLRILRTMRFGWKEWLFTLGWSGFFVLMRIYHLPQYLGQALTRFAS